MSLPGLLTVFTRATCPHCVETKELLKSKPFVRMMFVELDRPGSSPEEVEELRALLRELSQGAKTVPQIFLNERHLPGGNSNLQELQANGKLDDVLREGLSQAPSALTPYELSEQIRRRYVVAEIADLDF